MARGNKKSSNKKRQSFNKMYNEDYRTTELPSSRQRTKKSWTVHDINHISPLTPSQTDMLREYFEGQHIMAVGSAGVGKTFLACYLALQDIVTPDSDVDKIIIIRSAVPSRDMGFMPGDLDEKASFYEGPYHDIFSELTGYKNAYEDLKASDRLKFMTTSFVRGLTFDNAVIIIDECQSATFHELYSVLTRVGQNSKLIVCGDHRQDDLHSQRGTNRSGIQDLLTVCKDMGDVSVVNFTEHDIVRSGFVKEFIISCQHNLQGR